MKISVIVPIYNIKQEYLEQCIESLINQTYKNIEIILIDDFSTNYNNDELCYSYSLKDKRVKFYKNEVNIGAGATRNRGLSIATGEYISFIDADDWIDLKTYEKLIELLKKNNFDTIIFNAKKVYIDQIIDIKRSISGEYENCDFNLLRNFITTEELNGPCYILYSKVIIESNGIEFPQDIVIGEDLVFNSLYFFKANRIKFIEDSFYYYRTRSSSITNSFDIKKISDLCETYKIKKKVLNNYFFKTNDYNEIDVILSDRYTIEIFRILMYGLKYNVKFEIINKELSNKIICDIITIDSNNVKINIMKKLIKFRMLLTIKIFSYIYISIKNNKIKIGK